MSLFPCTKNTPITVCVYTWSLHSFLHFSMTRKQAVFAYRKNLWIQQHSASAGLVLYSVHACMNVSAGLSDASATLSLLARLFPCCVRRRRNISSRSCHCALWTALRSQGRQQSMMPGGGIFWKKTQKVMIKYILAKEKTAPNFELKWQKTGWTNLPRNLGKAWQQWLQCLQGGGRR